jgi:hypothetical protein
MMRAAWKRLITTRGFATTAAESAHGSSLQVGGIEVLPVIDCVFRAKPRSTFAGQPGDAFWEPHKYLLDDEGMMSSAMGGFLVRNSHNDRLMLVDLGTGVHKGFTIQGELLLQSLAACGYSPEDITDVVFHPPAYGPHRVGFEARRGRRLPERDLPVRRRRLAVLGPSIRTPVPEEVWTTS